MNSLQAAEWLRAADRAKRSAREGRRAFWAPLVIFGAITLLSSPLYRFPTASAEVQGSLRFVRLRSPLDWLAGGSFLRSPWLVSLFWLVALPVGYGLTVLYYRHRARVRGVATSVWPYVLTGIGLLAFLVVASMVGRLHPSNLTVRGLIPLLTIALGLCVLAWVERSAALSVFAVGFLSLTLLVDLYDTENLFDRVGIGVPVPAVSVIVPGAVLVLVGVGFWLLGRQQR